MNADYGFFTIFCQLDMLASPIIAVGFSLYKPHNYKTLYSPAQRAFVKLHFRRKLCNGSVSLFFNCKKRVTLCDGDTAANRISIKLFSKFTLKLAKTFSKLFYTSVLMVSLNVA